ncbi:MAG TPA: hypothetical protein ENF67_00415 [Candidatus Pacearchaeota archaeon]|nr:hypothetical protein [Candidatus Pacearchaeota archaeon]
MFKEKKAQEEMFGFVLIVVLVIIIGLVFLAFSLKKSRPSILQKSAQIDDLLNTMMVSVTKCMIEDENLSIKELIRKCHENENCDDGNRSCDVLKEEINETLILALGNSTEIRNKPIHGYSFSIKVNGTSPLEGIKIEAGILKGNSFTSSLALPLGVNKPNAEIKLKCWYNASLS